MSRNYVIGDIHGCIVPFREMIEEKLRLEKEDVLYLLGDYIDRGPAVKEVIDKILKLQEEGYQLFPIIGNHEYMLLKSINNPGYFDLWHMNGCIATLTSFGVTPDKVYEISSVQQIPEDYLRFFSSLPFYIEAGNYFFVHAGLPPHLKTPGSSLEDLVWTRSEIYNEHILAGKVLIHGHTPFTLNAIRARVDNKESKIINLDGGCVYQHNTFLGNLVAMDLDSKELFVVKNRVTG
ncbi:MAG: metallophosphoesterase family protein [Bacteroidota bacterium]|nr:metallophosphoesterase family protein [Bacteroidota bacterium]